MVQKKIPMRQCLGCREMFPKRELIRVVRKASFRWISRARPPAAAHICAASRNV